MTTRLKVITEAKSWIGTPYHQQASVKGAGVDCAYLLMCVYHEVGLTEMPDVGNYASDWHLHRSEEQYLSWVQKYAKRTENPQTGDIALFKFGRCVSHGAIVLTQDTVIHSYIGLGCVISSLTDNELSGRLDSFWTLWDK